MSNIKRIIHDDTLTGTSRDDKISGLDGNDTLYGLAGADNIDGGKGDDLIDGGAGDDRLNGNEGDDILIGGAGNDYIDGGPHGNDVARYSGNYADYQITRSGGNENTGNGNNSGNGDSANNNGDDQGFVITVKDLRSGSPDGTDTLRRIESIEFADRTIRIGGRDDAAVIGTPTVSSVTEDVGVAGNGRLTATGRISISDPDSGQSSFKTTVSGVGSPLGTLVLASDGTYTYSVANSAVQYLGAGAKATDTFTITSVDGTTKNVSFTINGTNDAALISGAASGTVTEAGGVANATLGTPTATGKLTDTDVDNPANTFLAVSTGTASSNGFGKYSMSAGGLWTYTLDNSNASVQALTVNQSLSDSFTVRTADGTQKVVTITINGANDAAVIGTPTVSSVSEDTNVNAGDSLTAQGSISVSDADAGQASFKTSVSSAPGNLGTLAMASNGEYLYTVANSAVQYLGANDTKIDSFTISSADSTAKTVSFTIKGANDAAVIGTPTASSVTEDVGVAGGKLTATGSISVSDADEGQASFKTSVSSASGNLGTLVMATNGTYTYTVADSAVQFLGANDSWVDSFTVKSADGTAKTVNFTINGANDAAVIGTPTVSSVTEDVRVGSDGKLTATGSISLSDADANQASFNTTAIAAPGNLGTLVLAANGAYTYSVANSAVQYLGAKATATDTFTVASADGTTKNVSFKITGANDAPVISANYGVTTKPNTAVAGSVTATDADGDTLVYSLDSAHKAAHGTVSVAANGSYTYTPGQGYTGADGFNIIVSDGHGGTITAAVTVNVTSGLINQSPVLAGTPAVLVAGIEDTAYTVTAADLLKGFTDPEGDTMSVAGLSANRGTVTDNGNGTYTIAPAANYNGPVALNYTVIDGKGGHTAATQNFSLAPVNDPAVIGGTASGSVTEAGGNANGTAGIPTASGTLTATDVDNPANTFQPLNAGTPSSNGYGTVAITTGGVWTYTLDNANATVQGLNANQTLSDSFTVRTADGTPQVVTINIKGANDAPVLAAPAAIAYADTEATDAFAAVTGTLSAADVDAGATQTYGITGGISSALAGYDAARVGPHGTLYLNSASGAYSFVPDSTSINALAAGTNTSDTFALTVSDGLGGTDSKTLTVNFQGANDASVISGVSGPLQYTVGQPNPTVVAPTLTLGDPDSGLVTSANVAISAGFRAGNDVLAFQLPNGSPITGHFDSATGVLSFTGSATLAQYQTALDSVTFHTSTIGERTISFTVFDGAIASVTADTSNISLESLSTTGFKISGEAIWDGSGNWVSTAGDVNGDGYADVIVGAPWADGHGAYTGRSYVIFGKSSAFAPDVPLWSIDGSNGFRLTGEGAIADAGFSVSTAGDLNGDGFDDLIIGSPYVDGYAGASYVVFGRASFSGELDSNANLELSSLNGSNGFRLSGAAAADHAGLSVSSAGDVNGDGYADVIVGAPYAGPNGPLSGASYVVFGSASGFQANVNLSALDAASGFRILGEAQGDRAGIRVSAAGDVNGDGFADVIIGAPNSEANGADSGASYVVFGKASGFSDVQLSTLNGKDGFRIAGAAPGDMNGYGVRAAGDVNGDGFDDVIVGSFSSAPNGVQSGAAYVVFGKAAGFAANLNLSALNGNDGFRIAGGAAGDMAGYAVGGIGDFNGDGYDDVIVGAPGAGGARSGSSYVVFGKAEGFSATLDLGTIGGADGFRVSGVAAGDDSGYAVSGAGDVNGDGFDDLMVSSAHASPNGMALAGESYVIFGAKLVVGGETYLGGTGNDTLTGTATAEVFIGGQGDDTIIGNGGKDAFSGGAGDDTIHLGAPGQSAMDFIHINGGSGFDTLALDGSGVTLDFTASGADRVNGIERIDLTGNGNNRLVLDIRDVLNISDSSNRLFVMGNAGDSVVSAGQGWALSSSGPVTDHGHTFDSYTLNGAAYTQGMANLLIEHPLTVLVS